MMGAVTGLISGIAPRLLAAGIVVIVVAGCLYGAAHEVRSMTETAASTARAERDAHWQGEIAKANAAVAQAEARQAREAMAINQSAADEISRLKSSLAEMEIKNASLPNGDACGLDAARVRLLPR